MIWCQLLLLKLIKIEKLDHFFTYENSFVIKDFGNIFDYKFHLKLFAQNTQFKRNLTSFTRSKNYFDLDTFKMAVMTS